ncbi:MAG: YdbL family protein [Pseudomonadota bacterium]|nr:YdbL family protein [Pseudomonadota bacterium]
MRKFMMMTAIAAMSIAGVAYAQSDWKAARTQGLIGEQPDGYLGIVGAATPELRATVNGINIQRKSVYTKESASNGSTVEAFALTAGCNQIANLPSGEKYKTPSGAWKTRTAAPPERDSRCP